LRDYLSSRLTQRYSCELLRQNKSLIFFIALSDQSRQVSVDIHSPHFQFLEHNYELLYNFELYQHSYSQSQIGVKQLPQSHLIFRGELDSPYLALAEGGGFVAEIVEKEA
jgi:hypothetical protein